MIPPCDSGPPPSSPRIIPRETVPTMGYSMPPARPWKALSGRIVERRGPLGPGGAQIYSVLVRRKPEPKYIELRENQLELVPANG